MEKIYIPGDYIKQIALNIIKNNKKIKLDNFDDCYEALKKLSLKESMSLIKR